MTERLPMTTNHKPITPGDFGAIWRRRWLLILMPVLLGPAVGYGVSLLLRSRYTSQSLLLFEHQRVPQTYVQPVITEDLNERVENISEQTLSRTSLQPLVERYGLFKKEASHLSLDELIVLLQKAVELTPIKPIVRSREETVPGFKISVTLDDPHVAQQVCADIASMFVDENLRQREHTAQGTTSFLRDQLQDAQRNLNEQDAKLAAFKRKYAGMLPDELQTTLNMLGPLQSQLEAVTQALNRAQEDKTYTESVLEQQVQAWEINKALKLGMTPGGATDSASLEKRLSNLQDYLAGLRSHYTEDFPEVISVKAQIEVLRKQIREAAAGPEPKVSAKAGEKSKEPEPPAIQQLRAQAHAYADEIQANTLEQRRLTDQIKEYEGRLQMSPVVEQEYKRVSRDYQTALQFYNDLLAKSDQSGMATDLERRQQGEQFRVVDSANLPDKPSFPNRLLFAIGGEGIGLAVGLGLAFLQEMADKRIRTEAEIEFYIGARPLALIPAIEISTNGSDGPKGHGSRGAVQSLLERMKASLQVNERVLSLGSHSRSATKAIRKLIHFNEPSSGSPQS